MRALPWLATAMLLPVLALAVPRPLHLGRSPSPGDEDLRVVRRPVADQDNGFYPVAEGKSVYWPEELARSDEAYRLANGTSSDWTLAEEIVANNADLLRRLDESLNRKDFQFPQFDDPVQWIALTIKWRDLVNVQSVAAFLNAEKNGTEAGLKDAIKILRFGQRVQGAQGAVMQWLMGSHLKRQGYICIRSLALRPDVGTRRLVALSRELERYAADRQGFAHTIKFDYWQVLRQFDKIAHNELDPDSLDLEATRRRLADVMRTAIRCATRAPDWGVSLAPIDYAGCETPDDEICNQFAEGWHLGLQDGAMEDTVLAATRTLLALSAYEQEHGSMARNIAALVPTYLPDVPRDPFDGEPLRYSAEERIVYSIGTDLEDNGGSRKEKPNLAREDRTEPTFRF